ncbi:MAG: hypothetical protein WBD67_05580 [Terracidiphilus sp.]
MTNPLQREAYIRGRLLLLVFAEATILMPLALAFAHGMVSPRMLGWLTIASSMCLGAAWFWILRRAQEKFPATKAGLAAPLDATTKKRLRRTILLFEIGVVFFALNLIYGLYESRGDPWSTIALGAGVNLLIQGVFIRIIFGLRRRLKRGTG